MRRRFACTLAILLSIALGWHSCADDVSPPAKEGAFAPHASVDSEGGVILSWLEPTPGESENSGTSRQGSFALRFARWRDGEWSDARTVVERSDFFANWADVPGIIETADRSLIAWWLEMAGEDTYAYHIVIARSTDGGATWQRIGPLHDDRSPTEHGFVSVAGNAADVRFFWLDGREMSAGEHGHAQGDMQLRTTTLGEEAVPAASGILDSRVCECCGTDAAISAEGPIVAYRDRGEQETRDISIVRWRDGAWSEPRPVHEDGWRIFGCPVNGPSIDARGQTVACAWFTSPENEGRVLVAFSNDAGRTWEEPLRLAGNEAIGRVQVAFISDDAAVVCWLEADGREAAVALQRVRPGGVDGAKIIAGSTVASRESGFPQMAIVGNEILVVWTTVEEGRLRLRGRLLPATLAVE